MAVVGALAQSRGRQCGPAVLPGHRGQRLDLWVSVLTRHRRFQTLNASEYRSSAMPTFATPTPISAMLSLPASRIQLIATDRTDTTVEVRPADAGKSRDVKAAEQATVEYANGVLRITTPEPRSQVFGPSGAVQVTIELPAGSTVEAATTAAELHTEGRLGDVSFEAYHQIIVDEVASARLTTADGDVQVARLTGPAEISTQRGDIRIAEAVRGTVTLTTQAGDITVDVAAGVSAALDAGAGHGRVTNSLKNDGTPALDIRATTSHGDITARSL
jgi:hypothetical protein